MITRRQQIRKRIDAGFDLALIASSFFLAYYVRSQLQIPFLKPLIAIDYYLWLLLLVLPTWMALLYLHGGYRVPDPRSLRSHVLRILRVNFEGFLILTTFFFVFRVHIFNRTVIVPFILTCTVLLTLKQALAYQHDTRTGRRSDQKIKVLVIGTGRRAVHLIEEIGCDPHSEVQVVGCLGREQGQVGMKVAGVPILDSVGRLSEVLHERVVDEVIVALPLSISYLREAETYIEVCQTLGINCRIMVDFGNIDLHQFSNSRMSIDSLGEIPLVSLSSVPQSFHYLYTKRLLDLFGAVVLLIVGSPLMAFAAIGIRLSSPGPVLFRQVRVGVNGRQFALHKFRTMLEGAEAERDRFAGGNVMEGPVFKDPDDPRITPFGRVLRKTSIDELPQLWNVLKGDMSLVGPRPLPVEEMRKIKGPQRRRLSIRPGITCLWQTSGRNAVPFVEWMKLDMEYIDNWSLCLDLKILLMTIPAVLSGRGSM